MKGLFALTAVVVLAFGVQGVSAQELDVGDDAPAFDLPGTDGNMHSLADYEGTTVVLAWFPKAFTGGWTAECKSLRDSSDQLNQFNIQYFMISVDEPDVNKEFAESLHADFPLLSDPGKGVATAYGVINDERPVPFRWTFVIGPDGKIMKIDKEVQAARAGLDLVAHLGELNVAKK